MPTVLNNDMLSVRIAHGLHKDINNFAKHMHLTNDLYQIHVECISKILDGHDLFCKDANVACANRKFVMYIVWTCPDICAYLLNNDKLNWSLDDIENELQETDRTLFVDKKCMIQCATAQLVDQRLLLYSIWKFIGQYTSNEAVYQRCWILLQKLHSFHDPLCSIVSPVQLQHLFCFNKNFSRTSPIPDKLPNSIRLFDYFSNGYYQDKFINERFKFKKFRMRTAYELIKTNTTRTSCLYYLESLYYEYFTGTETIYQLIHQHNYSLIVPEKQIGRYVTQIAIETITFADYNTNWSNEIYIDDEVSGRRSVKQIVNEKIRLLITDDPGPNNQNGTEIVFALYEIINSIPDDDYPATTIFNILRMTLLDEMFAHGFIKPTYNDPYAKCIMYFADKYERTWPKHFLAMKMLLST